MMIAMRGLGTIASPSVQRVWVEIICFVPFRPPWSFDSRRLFGGACTNDRSVCSGVLNSEDFFGSTCMEGLIFEAPVKNGISLWE